VANRRAIDLAVRLALALEAEVQPLSVFARKNYFYPDLPKGYQISQYDRPLALGGRLAAAGDGRAVRIHRLHLEEDAGKLMHELPGSAGRSLVDFNRCGVPLVEIVTEPDLQSAVEAQEFLQALHRILRYTDTSDGNMEEGSLRCDANLSLRAVGARDFGTKTEVKNLNSFRNVARALEYEIERQTGLLEDGEAVVQETRGFDADSGETRPLRGKEEARDYRYFPEPDLPPLLLTRARIDALRASLPELPVARRQRFVATLGLPAEDAAVLTAWRELADYFEAALAGQSARARAVGNWVRGPLLALLRERRLEIERAPAPARLAELVAAIEDGAISHAAGKDVLAALLDGDGAPREIAARLGLVQIDDPARVEAWVGEVLAAHAAVAADLRAGKTQALAFLVGQVMKRSAGRADPKKAQELLRSALGIGD
jgi:aspartyl-tRNA(Asn)/glutamyl-tRNA(Gln) amidotransferase subunit B